MDKVQKQFLWSLHATPKRKKLKYDDVSEDGSRCAEPASNHEANSLAYLKQLKHGWPAHDLTPVREWTPALKAAFKFVGVDDPRFVDAQPLQFSDQDARIAALVRAKEELGDVAAEWAAWEYARLGLEVLEAA